MLFLPAAALCCLCSALVSMAAELIQGDLTLTRGVGETVSFSCGGFQQCSGDYYIFGSGTRLFVSDESVVKPVVSVYPAASRVPVERGSSLLCLASAMFPPVVQFSWKRQNDMLPVGKEQLKVRVSEYSASVLLIHQKEDSSYNYSCSVKHEGGTLEVQTQHGNEVLPTPPRSTAAPTSSSTSSSIPAEGTASVPPLDLVFLSFQSESRVKLLCLLYTVLIVKSLVYCCGLSLLMILRNKGASTNSKHAD
ncbi:hypothetical protein OJAV_G00169630 [Oryzias javanicus]|uniref:Ig-like domain-containing protein n=1 Tax=Oryzias javanicus TaxID=123683 RepID=A0A437CGA5_ORYJA|nr:hypothetical protein OJAV_G00169630 [Oryzias javanicus]